MSAKQSIGGRRWAVVIVSLGLLCVFLPVAPGAENEAAANEGAGPAAEIGAAELEKLIDRHVRDLGSDDFETRESAEAALRSIGLHAYGAVEGALKSQDAEVRFRAERVLKALDELAARQRAESAQQNRLWRKKLEARPGRATAAAEGVLVVSTMGQGLVAVDAATGKDIWKYEIDSPHLPQPVIRGGKVLVNTDKALTALDLKTGQALWMAKLDKPVSRAVISGDRVIVFAGEVIHGDPEGKALAMIGPGVQLPAGVRKQQEDKDKSGLVVALHVKDGSEAWRKSFEQSVVGAPAANENIIVAGRSDGKLMVLDAATGKVNATVELGDELGPVAPVLRGGVAYVQHDGQTLAVDLAAGKQLWKYAAAGDNANAFRQAGGVVVIRNGVVVSGAVGADATPAAPVVTDDLVVLTNDDGEGGVVALDRATGRQRWASSPKAETDDEQEQGNQVVINGQRIQLRAQRLVININGRQVNVGESSARYTTPVVDGQTLLVGSAAGLFALDLKTGKTLWHFKTDAGVDAAPVVRHGVAYFTATTPNSSGAMALAIVQQGNGRMQVKQPELGENTGLFAVRLMEDEPESATPVDR